MKIIKLLWSFAAIVVFFSQGTVVWALSDSQRAVFDSGVYFFDSEAEEACLGGEFGSGPLYGPHFPKVADTAELASRIQIYISNTLPNSPLAKYSKTFVQLGQKYNVNPVLVVAMAQKETSLGTAGYGRPPKYNIGNMRGGHDGTGFQTFANYPQGIEATYKNLASGLYLGPPSNFTTVDQIIKRWAPPSDGNDTTGYIKFIGNVMQKVLQGIKTEAGVSDTETDTNPSCGSTAGSGLVNADGYAFPVAPQTKKANSKVAGLSQLPCPQPSCHHDGTAAFDIGRQPGGDASTGTPVYAISDGKIDQLHIYMGIAGCYSLQLHSSKDNEWYWYGHIQKPIVKNGDKVKAGQQLAEIGLRKCTGNGSTPHLHIDRGCTIDNVPQKGGRESCRDPDFTPFMNKLFNSLPRG